MNKEQRINGLIEKSGNVEDLVSVGGQMLLNLQKAATLRLKGVVSECNLASFLTIMAFRQTFEIIIEFANKDGVLIGLLNTYLIHTPRTVGHNLNSVYRSVLIHSIDFGRSKKVGKDFVVDDFAEPYLLDLFEQFFRFMSEDFKNKSGSLFLASKLPEV